MAEAFHFDCETCGQKGRLTPVKGKGLQLGKGFHLKDSGDRQRVVVCDKCGEIAMPAPNQELAACSVGSDAIAAETRSK